MSTIAFTVLPPPVGLARDVECIRIATYQGKETGLKVMVCPNGMPGLVFGLSENGLPAIKSIVTQSLTIKNLPVLFLHGQGSTPSIMRFNAGPFTTIQIVLKPHALYSIFGMDASALGKGYLLPEKFGAAGLTQKVSALRTDAERVTLLCSVLLDKLIVSSTRDELIEKSLQIIQHDIAEITVKELVTKLHISERQFQKRFFRVVGMQPQMYIRVKRINEALRLMATGKYERLSDVAHAINFYDQPHFIHEMKAFSWVTPKDITQKVSEFHQDLVGASYM
ncbi:transcriptional regulator, AraC family [candidate division TM7 genomosp. GTL1]|nr:transcriptional regulator, AraC family [candidate division TM7 genomosp. GTL1]